MRNALTRFLQIALLFALAACRPSDAPAAATAHEDTMVPLQVGILNYTDDYIDEVYVNGSWSGGMVKHAGGGGFAGHAEVPRQWDPNYKLTVRWRTEPLYLKSPDAFYERELTTQPYQLDERGRMTFLWVAFFPGGVAKLFPTLVGPGHPDFPEGLLAPKLQCRKEHPGSAHCEGPPQLWDLMRKGKAAHTEDKTP
ncbi:DUF3304 domain-containing protein [Cupriavidus basilensis]|uniref:DUF3304 domain-containing protein n=1 Tax=Cupriavidus basilensis TaxID=68895 RepID=A0ABT6B078_9BURK|nr:DUF3304 domain-containing protein [Cupriavidus basilensis]MDF3838290.1 DUF3304 domain-containing protein [Cupriavidus basilensis]